MALVLPWLYHRTSSPSAGLPAGSPQGGRGLGRRGATRGAPDAEFIGSSPRKNGGNRAFSLRNHGDFSWFSLLNGRSMLVYVEQCFLSTGGTTLWLVIVLWCLNAGSPIPLLQQGRDVIDWNFQPFKYFRMCQYSYVLRSKVGLHIHTGGWSSIHSNPLIGIYPLVNVNKKLWKITMLLMGKLYISMMFGFPLWDENYSHTPWFDSIFFGHILGYGHTAMTIRL